MRKNAAAERDDHFADWLRRAKQELKRGDLPPESWELRRSPLEDSAAQRRIAELISRIAAREGGRRH